LKLVSNQEDGASSQTAKVVSSPVRSQRYRHRRDWPASRGVGRWRTEMSHWWRVGESRRCLGRTAITWRPAPTAVRLTLPIKRRSVYSAGHMSLDRHKATSGSDRVGFPVIIQALVLTLALRQEMR